MCFEKAEAEKAGLMLVLVLVLVLWMLLMLLVPGTVVNFGRMPRRMSLT